MATQSHKSDTAGATSKGPLAKAVDQQVIQDLLTSVGPGTATVLITAFLEEMRMRISDIITAIQTNDKHTMILNAHSLKGASGTFGANQIEAEAEAIESSGNAGNGLKKSQLADLNRAQKETEAALRQILAQIADTQKGNDAANSIDGT